MYLITFENCQNYQKRISQMRTIFSEVFSKHYTTLIRHANNNNDSKTLDGFGDLITKYFPNKVENYSFDEMAAILKKLYATAGFDDEEAFLLSFRGYSLSESQKKEVVEYAELLKADNRQLTEINFVALIDSKDRMRGFLIYHLFDMGEKTILHIRQAAMLDKERGYAKVMARFLIDHYPKAFYEANQRWANHVSMKNILLNNSLIRMTNPVLGYPQRYIGLRGNYNLLKTAIAHYGLDRLGFKRYGQVWETDSIPALFSQHALIKDCMLDDNFVGREKAYPGLTKPLAKTSPN